MSNFHNAKTLPSKGNVGDVYRVSTTGDMFLAVGDGTLVSLSDLLSERNRVRAVGPQGETGRQGAAGRDGRDGVNGTNGKDGANGISGPKGECGVPGPQGIPGKDGRDGTNGKDATGPQGPRGEKGEPGNVLYVGDDALVAAVETLRQELLQHRAKLAHALNDAKAINQTMRGGNSRTHREQVVNQIERLTR